MEVKPKGSKGVRRGGEGVSQESRVRKECFGVAWTKVRGNMP